MNNPNPLVPQGSLLEQKSKGRARVRIAVFLVLAIHGIGLFALLIQGCNKAPESGSQTAQEQPPTNAAPTFAETPMPQPAETNPTTLPGYPPATSAPPTTTSAAPPGTPSTPETTSAVPPAVEQPVTPPSAPAAAGSEYSVVKGDTLAKIARKNSVSLKALREANPGVEPTRLKIGQKLHIPAAAMAMAATGPNTGSGATATDDASGGSRPEVRNRYAGDQPRSYGLQLAGASVSSTRRFIARPAAVSFGATGSASPCPTGETRFGFTPCEIMYCMTFSARFSDSTWFEVMPCC